MNAFDPRITQVPIPMMKSTLDPYRRGWWHGWIIGVGGVLTGFVVGQFLLRFLFHS
jgi:hypothetical protein